MLKSRFMRPVTTHKTTTVKALKQRNNAVEAINKGFALAFTLGMIDGLKVLPKELHLVAYMLVSIACVLSVFKRDERSFFQLLPYLIYGELYVRDSFIYFPYNFLPYLSILLFTVLLVQQKITTGRHSVSFYFLAGYALLEFIDLGRARDVQYAWMQFTNSLLLALLAMWGSHTYLSPQKLNRFLVNIQMAGVFTCGYLAIAHFTGNINYEHASNFGASNGLPPNQLSTYLGFPCILFAFAVLNSNKNVLVNSAFLIISCALMTFTFSRGGIYFLIAILAVYFWLNRKKERSYKMLLLLVPVGFAVYLYIMGATHGMLAERYQEAGYSGRDDLAVASIHLFWQRPIIGVGTSNYNSLIAEEKLFHFNSSPHNEITRAMAEHGLLGIIFFWGFFVVLFTEIWQRSKIQRDYSFYFLLLFLLSIVHNGLKTGLQAYLLLLAVALPTVVLKKKAKTTVLLQKPATGTTPCPT